MMFITNILNTRKLAAIDGCLDDVLKKLNEYKISNEFDTKRFDGSMTQRLY